MKPMLSQELYSFFAMMGLGVIIGVIFDLLRALRMAIPKREIFCHITDIIFWVMVAFMTFKTLFIFSDGEIRFFLVISAFLSMILYFLTVSKWVKHLFFKVFYKILNIFKFILKILLTPLEFLYKILLIRTFRNIRKIIDKFIKKERLSE